MAVKHVKNNDFESEVLKSDKKVLVDFYADWCGPCKMMGPVLEAVAKENDNIDVVKINVDEEQELAMQYRVMSIPALMVFEKGEVVKKSVGLISKAEVLDLIK